MITFKQVKLADTQHVVESFLTEHWEFNGDADLKCKPDWNTYHSLEKLNRLLLIFAMDDERPIGYLAAFIHPHMNSIDNLVASVPTYFVEERPGRAFIMRSLLEAAITALKARSVVHINVDTHWEHSAGKLLQKLGFRPSKIGYKLRLP